jgi:tRNA (guanine37-N1)-methyltransferase
MFAPVLNESILKRAQKAGHVEIRVWDIRDYSLDKHRKVDDRPYGGGCGMIMAAGPIFSCVEAILKKTKTKPKKRSILLFSPKGKKFRQNDAKKLASKSHLILICGRYEGVDERVARYLADEEISIGDYVLTGGELPAMVLIDTITRLLPGVLGNVDSNRLESFENNMLEYPQYTRPAVFNGKKVPAVLMSGDHGLIASWRQKEAVKITKKTRPDIVKQ